MSEEAAVGSVIEPPAGPGPHDREELVEYLESDQLAQERARPLSRAQLSERATAGLWALRVLAVVLAAMVIYTFFSQLG